MKINFAEESFHVLDAHFNVWSVITKIAESKTRDDPFYICDVGDVVKKNKAWKALLPRVQPYYAVKCNNSLIVLEVLAALGVNFDCTSKAEINKVLSLGVNSNRIIFGNPAKPASHIRHAAAAGVSLMTFDNETELHKVKNFHPHAKLVIRIRCDPEDDQRPLDMKFGCDAVEDAPRLLAMAKELELDVIGVSFHVGSNRGASSMYRKAIELAKGVFDVADGLGFKFEVVDLGGGFPGHLGTLMNKIAESINSSLAEHFPDPSIRIIAEPGRYFVSSSFTLACNIHSIRDVISEDQTSKHKMYYINDGVYGSFNYLLYDHRQVLPVPLREERGCKYLSSSVWGPTCDALDRVVEEASLPEMKIGDWMVFEDMGAYTLPVASPCNGFPLAKIHVVADESAWLLLKDVLTQEHFVMNGRQEALVGGEECDVSMLPIKVGKGNVLEFAAFIQD